MVGIPHRTARKCSGCSDLVFHQSMDWSAMAEAEIAAKSDIGCVGACGRERRVEDHSSQPATSSLPNKSAELSLWSDPNSVSNLHALGRNRAGSGVISLLLPWNTWSIGFEPRARQDSSASDRVSCLVGWVCQRSVCSDFARANSAATASRGRKGCGQAEGDGPGPRAGKRSARQYCVRCYE